MIQLRGYRLVCSVDETIPLFPTDFGHILGSFGLFQTKSWLYPADASSPRHSLSAWPLYVNCGPGVCVGQKLWPLKCSSTKIFYGIFKKQYFGTSRMTQFEIECRCGGHSVTKKFKTILQLLLAKPKLLKKLNFYK